MSDLLTAADLEAAKKHDTFHSEVITGKAGGVAGGATIDTATNAVTMQVQRTLPNILEEIAAYRGGSIIVSDVVPSLAAPGTMWYCSSDGRTYVLYQDTDSTQWVDISPVGGGVSTGSVDSVNGKSGVVVLTADDISESTDKRYVTDQEKVNIGNTSGNNTGDETKSSIETKLAGSSVVTLAGNTFNGISQLVLTTADGKLPAIDGSLLTNLPVGSGAVDSVNGKTGTVVLTTANISDSTNKRYVTDAGLTVLGNTSGSNTGDETQGSIETKLAGSTTVTMAGNVFNGSSQLVQTTSDGKLPVIDGSNLTNLPAGTGAVDSVNGKTGVVVLTTADIADSTDKRYVTDSQQAVIGNTSGTNTGDETKSSIETKLSGSSVVTLAGNTFNGVSQLVQTTAAGKLPALDGSLLTNLPSGGGSSITQTTWAARPNATTAGSALIQVTDLDNHIFFSNGTRWKPVGGRIMLRSQAALTTTPLATLTGAGLFAVAGGAVVLPAGLLDVGSSVTVMADATSTAESSANMSLFGYIGTANTKAGSSAMTSSSLISTTAATLAIAGCMRFVSATTALTRGALGCGENGSATSISPPATGLKLTDISTRIDTDVDMYVNVGSAQDAASTAKLMSFTVFVEI